MNTLTRTIAVLATLNLLISGLALAQDVSEEELRDALADEAKEVDVALAKADSMLTPVPPVLPSGRYSISSRSRWPFRSSGVGSVLVIPSAEIETRDLLTINEDINVMSRIFVTNLQRAHISPSGGNIFVNDNTSALLNVLSGRNRTSIQSLYLQGYGVLFLMKVNFPLSPSHQVQQQDQAEQEEEGDKVWEATRRQLYEPQQVAKRKTDDSAAKYDAEKVENLKTTLIKALKHAANIRDLKPEESAILTITGGGKSAGVEMIVQGRNRSTVTRSRFLVRDKDTGRLIEETSLKELGLYSPTVLVIRAKKSDIDSFAKGDLDLEQFRQRVQMLSYPYLEGGSQRADILDYYYRSSVPKTVPSF